MAKLESFRDYLFALLPSAFKRIRKAANIYYALFRVIGEDADTLGKTMLGLRDQAHILSCSPELLPVFGQERTMPRLDGEPIEQYRMRLLSKRLISEQAGTNFGILTVVRSLGHPNAWIEPTYLTDPERWAEATVWIDTGGIVLGNRDALAEQVRQVKPASAKLWISHELGVNSETFFGCCFVKSTILDISEV